MGARRTRDHDRPGPARQRPEGEPGDPVVTTRYGAVRGRTGADGVRAFLGVPYAAPPYGPRRFRPPEPPEPWTGVRDAPAFGPTAPKPPYTPAFAVLLADPVVPGAGVLNLNVWTPPPGRDPDPAPVMVWIHGGALTRGTSAVPVYDGHAFARDGVVLVSLNYRLGVEGFGLFPDAPANLGLRDQIAALEWVRDNVAAFGGDPGRVTVFGESAGAISIAALLTSPAARGLFHRAVLQSGAPAVLAPDTLRRTTRRIAARLKVPATARALAAVDPARLLAAQHAATRRANPLTGGALFGLVADGELLPRDPVDALADGAADGIGLLLGATTEEYRLWLAPTGALRSLDRLAPALPSLARLKYGCTRAMFDAYRRGRPGESPAEVLGAVATDALLRLPLNRVADAHPGRAHLYEFAWRSRVPGLGACHALELGFVFDTLDRPESLSLSGPHPPRSLATAMHGAWVAFARTGEPGWEAWDARRPVMVYGEGEPRVVHAPREAERRLWRG
ncbi:carboxylesterase family protein [Streptomyces sp. NPDC001941]|uniref:carboxylesterase/lipase family protein n=1 Tax=Streptomyces sp. NPDC001941 TaxID=3154659 RepID=UPI00333065FA